MTESEGVALTNGGQKKLANLIDLKDLIIADAIRSRGGGQSQIDQLRTDYQLLRVGELANLASASPAAAETSIKILKQAKKKRDKYGRK